MESGSKFGLKISGFQGGCKDSKIWVLGTVGSQRPIDWLIGCSQWSEWGFEGSCKSPSFHHSTLALCCIKTLTQMTQVNNQYFKF